MPKKDQLLHNFVRTICVSCSNCKNEIAINLNLEYHEDELVCEECSVKQDIIDKEVVKFLCDSTVFCPKKCGYRGKFHEVKNHEKTCIKNVPRFLCPLCPALPSGLVQLHKSQDFIGHIQEEHLDKVIKVENFADFKFPVIVAPNISTLLLFNNSNNIELYWLQMIKKRKTIYMFIKHICSLNADYPANNMTFKKFSIISKSCNSAILTGHIVPTDTIHINIENENIIDMTAIKNMTVLVSMRDSCQDQLPSKFLSELECDICMQVLTIPIRLCNEGHSFCDACFKKVNRCPKCKAGLSTARNYALERIVNQVDTHCKNRDAGCKEKFNAENLQKHLDQCQFRSFNCNNCKKSMLYKDISGHGQCLKSVKLGVSYPATMKSPLQFLAFDELFILYIKPPTDDKNMQNAASSRNSSPYYVEYSYSNYAYNHNRSSANNSSGLMKFCVENLTSLKDVQFWFDITVSDKVDGKSITFSAKCKKENVVEIPANYFKEEKNLEICLNIYEKSEQKSSSKPTASKKQTHNMNKEGNEHELYNLILDCLLPLHKHT